MGNCESFCSQQNVCSDQERTLLLSPQTSVFVDDQTGSTLKDKGRVFMIPRSKAASPKFNEFKLLDKTQLSLLVPSDMNSISPKRLQFDEISEVSSDSDPILESRHANSVLNEQGKQESCTASIPTKGRRDQHKHARRAKEVEVNLNAVRKSRDSFSSGPTSEEDVHEPEGALDKPRKNVFIYEPKQQQYFATEASKPIATQIDPKDSQSGSPESFSLYDTRVFSGLAKANTERITMLDQQLKSSRLLPKKSVVHQLDPKLSDLISPESFAKYEQEQTPLTFKVVEKKSHARSVAIDLVQHKIAKGIEQQKSNLQVDVDFKEKIMNVKPALAQIERKDVGSGQAKQSKTKYLTKSSQSGKTNSKVSQSEVTERFSQYSDGVELDPAEMMKSLKREQKVQAKTVSIAKANVEMSFGGKISKVVKEDELAYEQTNQDIQKRKVETPKISAEPAQCEEVQKDEKCLHQLHPQANDQIKIMQLATDLFAVLPVNQVNQVPLQMSAINQEPSPTKESQQSSLQDHSFQVQDRLFSENQKEQSNQSLHESPSIKSNHSPRMELSKLGPLPHESTLSSPQTTALLPIGGPENWQLASGDPCAPCMRITCQHACQELQQSPGQNLQPIQVCQVNFAEQNQSLTFQVDDYQDHQSAQDTSVPSLLPTSPHSDSSIQSKTFIQPQADHIDKARQLSPCSNSLMIQVEQSNIDHQDSSLHTQRLASSPSSTSPVDSNLSRTMLFRTSNKLDPDDSMLHLTVVKPLELSLNASPALSPETVITSRSPIVKQAFEFTVQITEINPSEEIQREIEVVKPTTIDAEQDYVKEQRSQSSFSSSKSSKISNELIELSQFIPLTYEQVRTEEFQSFEAKPSSNNSNAQSPQIPKSEESEENQVDLPQLVPIDLAREESLTYAIASYGNKLAQTEHLLERLSLVGGLCEINSVSKNSAVEVESRRSSKVQQLIPVSFRSETSMEEVVRQENCSLHSAASPESSFQQSANKSEQIVFQESQPIVSGLIGETDYLAQLPELLPQLDAESEEPNPDQVSQGQEQGFDLYPSFAAFAQGVTIPAPVEIPLAAELTEESKESQLSNSSEDLKEGSSLLPFAAIETEPPPQIQVDLKVQDSNREEHSKWLEEGQDGFSFQQEPKKVAKFQFSRRTPIETTPIEQPVESEPRRFRPRARPESFPQPEIQTVQTVLPEQPEPARFGFKQWQQQRQPETKVFAGTRFQARKDELQQRRQVSTPDPHAVKEELMMTFKPEQLTDLLQEELGLQSEPQLQEQNWKEVEIDQAIEQMDDPGSLDLKESISAHSTISQKSLLRRPTINSIKQQTFLRQPTLNRFKQTLSTEGRDKSADRSVERSVGRSDRSQGGERDRSVNKSNDRSRDKSTELDRSRRSGLSIPVVERSKTELWVTKTRRESDQKNDSIEVPIEYPDVSSDDSNQEYSPVLIDLNLIDAHPVSKQLLTTMNLAKYEISTLDVNCANDKKLRAYLQNRVKVQHAETIAAIEDAIFAANFSDVIRMTFPRLSVRRRKALALSLKRDTQSMSIQFAERIHNTLTYEAGVFGSQQFLRAQREPQQNSLGERTFQIDASTILQDRSFAGVQTQIKKIALQMGSIQINRIAQLDQDPEEFEYDDSFVNYLTPAQLEKCLYTLVPIFKLDNHRYMIGTLQKQLILKNENLVIRVGGGFADFDQYIKQSAKIECLKILKKMEEDGLTFQQTLLWLLQQARCSERTIAKFMKDSEALHVPFRQIVEAVRSREGEEWLNRKLTQNTTELSIDDYHHDDAIEQESMQNYSSIVQDSSLGVRFKLNSPEKAAAPKARTPHSQSDRKLFAEMDRAESPQSQSPSPVKARAERPGAVPRLQSKQEEYKHTNVNMGQFDSRYIF